MQEDHAKRITAVAVAQPCIEVCESSSTKEYHVCRPPYDRSVRLVGGVSKQRPLHFIFGVEIDGHLELRPRILIRRSPKN